MPLPGLESAIPPRKRPQTHALDGAAAGIDQLGIPLGIPDTILPSLLPYATRFGFRPYADDQHEMLAQYYGSLQITQEVLHSGATAGRYTTQNGKTNHTE
jgi:hypothetical protein